MPKPVTINVGGTLFTTTKETLLKYKDTTFQKLFGEKSNAWKMQDANDHVFIDRDPTIFAHILNFMRGYSFVADRETLGLIYEDAIYYNINPIIESLRLELGKRSDEEEIAHKKTCLERLFALQVAYGGSIETTEWSMEDDTEEIENILEEYENKDEDKTIDMQADMIMQWSPNLLSVLCPAIEKYFGIDMRRFTISGYKSYIKRLLKQYRGQDNLGPIGDLVFKFVTDAYSHCNSIAHWREPDNFVPNLTFSDPTSTNAHKSTMF